MVDPVEEFFNSRDQLQARISRISKCWTRESLLLWTRWSRIPTSRRSVSRNRKPRKRIGFDGEDRSCSWSTTNFEWLALMIPYWIMLIYSLLLFMTTIFQEFDTRWGEVLLSMSKIPSDDIYGESVEIKNTWVWLKTCTSIRIVEPD